MHRIVPATAVWKHQDSSFSLRSTEVKSTSAGDKRAESGSLISEWLLEKGKESTHLISAEPSKRLSSLIHERL